MTTLRILHFSDLHMRANWSTDQNRVLRAFFRDLGRNVVDHQIDLAIFTGDLAFSGKPEQYKLAQDALLTPLEHDFGITRDRIVLVPGNHDVDRDLIPGFVESGLANQLTKRSSLNEIMTDSNQLTVATGRLDPWRNFRTGFYGNAESNRCGGLAALHNFQFEEVKVSVASLSTSWRATGGPDDVDRAKLLVGERQLTETLGQMDDDAIRIVAMHHPVDWLADFDRIDTARELGKRAELLLSGHVHLGDSILMASRQGTYIHSAAGSLYASREYLNSYSILDYTSETDKLQVTFRTYYDDRDEFGSGENLVEGGRITFDLKHIPAETVRVTEAAGLTRVRLNSLVRENLRNSGVHDADERPLIDPVFLPLPTEQYLSTTNPETGERLDLPDLTEDMASGDVIILAGEESGGLTCALAWLLNSASSKSFEISPALLDYNDVGTSHDPVDRSLRNWLSESEFAIHPSNEVDPLPNLAVAIDNFDPNPADRRANRVVAHLGSANEPVRIIGCRPHQVADVEDLLTAAGISSRRRYLGRFGRRHIRELSSRLDQAAPEKLAQAAFALFDRERIPRTPFMIIVVLEILVTSNYTTVGGSETDILSMHADRLLGRSETSEDQRFDFDYRNRQHLISRLAFEMLQCPRGQISRLEAESYIIAYLRDRDRKLRVSSVLDIFVQRKLLWERNGILGFRQPAMLSFFAASAATEDDALRNMLLDDPLRYATAVRHAAMLRRDDRSLLSTITDLLDSTLKDRSHKSDYFGRQSPKESRDTFNDSAFAKQVVESSEQAETSGSPLAPVVSDPDFDQILDTLDQRSELYEGEELSTREGAFGLLQIVSFCASVLRSSELVSDRLLRARALRLVITGYARTAEQIADNDVMEAAMEFAVALMEHMRDRGLINDDTVARALGLFRRQFPAIMTGMEMSNWLSSPKLSQSVRNCLIDDDFMSAPGEALMTAMLAMECNVEDRVEALDGVLESFSDVPSAVSAIQFVAYAMNALIREDDPKRPAVERLVVRASTCGIAYESPEDRVQHRERITAKIRKERLARAFKEKIEAPEGFGMPDAPIDPWDVTQLPNVSLNVGDGPAERTEGEGSKR